MNKTKSKLSIVIPVYNEEEAIADVISDVKNNLDELLQAFDKLSEIEIIFVNDGSIDKSSEIIRNAIVENKNLKLINLPKNLGYGAALKAGFANANGDIIGFYDADNTFKFKNIAILLKTLFSEGLDMVSGNRFTDMSKMPLVRKLGNKFYSMLIHFFTYKKILDPGSGIRVIKKEVIFKKLYPLPDGLNFIIVLTTKALFENVVYKELQIPYDERVGRSKLNVFKDGIRFLQSMFSVIKLNNLFKFYFLTTTVCLILAGMYVYPAIKQYTQYRQLRNTDVLWLIGFVFFLNISLVSYSIGVIANVINKKIFGKFACHSVLSEYLTNKKLYSKFNVIGFILIVITLIIYILMKFSIMPNHYATYILFTMLGFYGFQLVTVHYLIQMIDEQLVEDKTKK